MFIFPLFWRLEVKMLPGLVSSETSLPGQQTAAFLCLYLVFSLFVHRRRTYVCDPALASLSLFMRAPILSDQLPRLMTSFNLNYLLKGSVSKYSHIGGQGLGLPTQKLLGDTTQSTKQSICYNYSNNYIITCNSICILTYNKNKNNFLYYYLPKFMSIEEYLMCFNFLLFQIKKKEN